MIEAKKLTKRCRPITSVDGVTFTARPGHVTGFHGPNGAGGADDDHASHPRAAARQMKDHCRKDISNHVCHR